MSFIKARIALHANDLVQYALVRANAAAGGGSVGPLGAVQFSDGAGGFAADAPFFTFDNVNNRLGVGTNVPTTTLDVAGSFNQSGSTFNFSGTGVGNIDTTSTLNIGTVNTTNINMGYGALPSMALISQNLDLFSSTGTLRIESTGGSVIDIGSSSATGIIIGRLVGGVLDVDIRATQSIDIEGVGGTNITSGIDTNVDATTNVNIGGTVATAVNIGRVAGVVVGVSGDDVDINAGNDVDIDASGNVNLGAANANAVSVGNASSTTSVTGSQTNVGGTNVDLTCGLAGSIEIGLVGSGDVRIGQTDILVTINAPILQGSIASTVTSIESTMSADAVFAVQHSNVAGTATADGARIICGDDGAGVGAQFAQFSRPDSTVCGSITKNGAAAVLYNTTSDSRMKERLEPSSYGLSALNRLQVYEFQFKGSDQRSNGLIAQEVANEYPFAVSVGNEKRMWGIDYGQLTPLLIRAVQELSEKVDTLMRARR